MTAMFTDSCWITSRNSSTSKWRPEASTAAPPVLRLMSWVNSPVPCISGQPGSETARGR